MKTNQKALIFSYIYLNRRYSQRFPLFSHESYPKIPNNCATAKDSGLHFAPAEIGVLKALPCSSRQILGSTFSKRNICSQSAEIIVERCWNCTAAAESKPFLSCMACGSVQPLDQSVDYFQIFGLEKRYDIQTENLESIYKDWQKKLHPDLVHSKSEKEKLFAAEQSARVIDAYCTLRKPLLRALYLMQLEGVHVNEEETVYDPEMLDEIMEVREAVEEACDDNALKQIQSLTQQKLENWSHSFLNAYRNQEFKSAATSIQRMRYYERVLEEIDKKL